MATTKLVLRIDDLAHKLVTAESEVAVGEAFDVFFANAVDWDGRTVNMSLHGADGRILWRLNAPVATMTEGGEQGFGVKDCGIATVEAADATARGPAFAVITVRTEDADGTPTVYGVAKVKLHAGFANDGTPLEELQTDLEEHNADPEAHEAIRDEIAEVETSLLASANKALHEHAQAEEAARNEAIHNALRETYQKVTEELKKEMEALTETAVAEAIAGALAKAGCNQLTAPVRLIRKDGSGNPVLLIGSQVDGDGMKEDRWTLALHYDRLVLKTAPGGEAVTLTFNRPGDDKAESNAIVLWKELVAALEEATEGLIGAEGGTVGGILRMKNPKVAADDDPAHDIAVVPNAGGQGLQLQFPGGATAMVRAKTGTVATTAEVNDAVAAEVTAREQGDADTLSAAKAYADGKVAGAYRYKGTVATVDDLPASGNAEGDVWNVSADGMNYAWTGSAWDALGASVDLSDYSTTEEMNAAIQRHNTSSVAHSTYIYPLQQHVKEANARLDTLEEQMGDLLYKAIAFTSGSATPNVAEVGATVTSVLLKWALNKEPEALTLDGTALGVTETQKTVTGSWTAAKTWVLKATDERGATATRNLTLAFQNKAYWGVGTATGTAIDDAFVLGLSGSAFATGRGRTFSANAGAGQFIYYVFPKSWGTPVFKVGGFEGGFALDREWEHTNASGGKVQYQAWRSTNAALGQTTVVVS